MKPTLLSAALASVLVLSGCGNNDDEEAKTAISEYLVSQQSQSQLIQLEEEEADCIAGDMVDGIGVDQLQEYGLIDEDGTVPENAQADAMEQEDAEVMVDSVFDCTDVMATVEEQLGAAIGQQSPEVQECLSDALTEELVREALVANFAGNPQEAQQKLTGPLTECLGPGAGSGQPDGSGDSGDGGSGESGDSGS